MPLVAPDLTVSATALLELTPRVGELLYVGVDVGGTKVAAGLVDASGGILSHVRVPMISHSSAEEGLNAVLAALDQVTAVSPQISGIGICAPGPLDPQTGVILNPPNVPCWHNFPLAKSVQKNYPVQVKIDNDANAAALAETRWGAARGYKNVFYATIGTGIGTGIIIDGRMYHGRTGSAGEGGHVSIDYRGPICRCGKRGCIETLASGTAIVQRAREKISAGSQSMILEMAAGKLDAVTGEVVAKAYAQGDSFARELLLESVKILALWLSNMIDLFDPEVIVIGGGAAALYGSFFDVLRRDVPKLTVNPRASEVPISPAFYADDSGIAGGAALCT
jgi:glucokinase